LYLNELGFQMFAFVQIQWLQVQFQAQSFGGQQDGSAGRAAESVVKVDSHSEIKKDRPPIPFVSAIRIKLIFGPRTTNIERARSLY